jgi:hypothetical protein
VNGANAVQPHNGPPELKPIDPLRELAGKIFSRADWEYVTREPGAVRSLYIKERRALALQWLTEIRRLVSLLMDYHRELEKDNYHLRHFDRLKLYLNYIHFQSLSLILSVLIRVVNPLYAARLAERMMALADRFSNYIPPSTRLF